MRYVKPELNVTLFNLNDTIAACPVVDTYNPVTVYCVISGTHDIFYGNCESNYNDMTIVSYNGQEYLVWANSHGGGNNGGRAGGPGQGGGGNSSGSSLLQAILAAGGLDSDNWQNYHAGPINPDITSTRNSSI